MNESEDEFSDDIRKRILLNMAILISHNLRQLTDDELKNSEYRKHANLASFYYLDQESFDIELKRRNSI